MGHQLQSDSQELEEASDDGDKKFDEQEKELIELIRMKREELAKLEDTLRGQQPALADKLKQAAETNLTLLAAGRSVERDGAMLNASERKCELFARTSSKEATLRSKLLDALKIGTKLLEHVDTTAFIAKDMSELRAGAPSFVQTELRMPPQSQRFNVSPPVVPLPKLADSSTLFVSLLQASAAATSKTATATSIGPFDEVSQMIEELISSLRAQANGDVDQHQFCEESKMKNRNARHLTENSIDEKATEVHWALTSVERLDDEIAFLEGEAKRLADAVQVTEVETKAEEKRFEEENAHRAKGNEVIDGAVSVLVELCELGTSFISRPPVASVSSETEAFISQGSRGQNSDSRDAQCGKVVEELKVAKTLVGQLTKVAAANIDQLRQLLSGLLEQSRLNAEARNSDMLAAKKKDLALIQEAQQDLEQNCGPARETHVERKQRREQEIDALKKKMASTKLSESEMAIIQKGLSELEKDAAEVVERQKTVLEEEQKQPWNVDSLSSDGFSKSIINKPVPRTNEHLTEEEREEKMRNFVKAHKKEIEEFGWLKKYEDSKAYMMDRTYLACEETANYLVIHCLNLELEEKCSAMEQVAHQCICVQYLLELAKQLDVDPRSCISSFFSKIAIADQEYRKAFEDELEAFKTRIRNRAIEKLKEQIEEAKKEEEIERQSRLGPGGLDPVEVFESLPKVKYTIMN